MSFALMPATISATSASIAEAIAACEGAAHAWAGTAIREAAISKLRGLGICTLRSRLAKIATVDTKSFPAAATRPATI